MYSEIIYTRCGMGMDLLKQGAVLPNEGMKVYSTSTEVFTDGSVVDFYLVSRAMQAAQSYRDPEFMEDAFLYTVPDRGDPLLLNFHPTPFDPNLTGNFSNRPGHFINQAFVGDFSQVYPCEIMLQSDIWDAQKRGVAYYYETPTARLAQRDLRPPASQVMFEEAGAFVAAGRQKLLKESIAFLVSQFALPPHARKYLVIKDEGVANITRWMAAIGYAFSAEMAAQIPFATRMDKFVSTNRYTVDGNGMFCAQVNLQDPSQKLRYRAMVIGVDSRDAANVRAAREAPAKADFAVMDAGEGWVSFTADTANPYFDAITRFDDDHWAFCREILPAYGLHAINGEIPTLYEAWQRLRRPNVLQAQQTAADIAFLSGRCAMRPDALCTLYAVTQDQFVHFVRQDAQSALAIADWLVQTEDQVGQSGTRRTLTEAFNEALAEALYGPNAPLTSPLALWEALTGTAYALPAAACLVEMRDTATGRQAAEALSLGRLTTLCGLSMRVDAVLGRQEDGYTHGLFVSALQACHRQQSRAAVTDVLAAVAPPAGDAAFVQTYFFSLLRVLDTDSTAFVIDAFLTEGQWPLHNNAEAMSLYDALRAIGCGPEAGLVFVRRATQIGAKEGVDFLDMLSRASDLDSEIHQTILEKMDSIIEYSDESTRLAYQIQALRAPSLKCPRSASLCLLHDLEKKNKGALRQYHEQGPRMDLGAAYREALSGAIAKTKLYEHEHLLLLTMFEDTSEGAGLHINAYARLLTKALAEEGVGFASLMTALSRRDLASYRAACKTIVVAELVDMRPQKKVLASVAENLRDKAGLALYEEIMGEADSQREAYRRHTLRGRVGGLFQGKKDRSKPKQPE